MSTPTHWRDYKRHAISARYPNITGHAFEDMKANLKKRGASRITITLYEGQVLDGWQRYRCCLANDMEPRFVNLRDGEDPEAYVEEANEHRRHESAEAMAQRAIDRRERVAKKRAEGKSIATIADEEGVSKRTIANDLKKTGEEGSPPEPPEGGIKGKDGKTYTRRGGRNKKKSAKNGQTEWNPKTWIKAFGDLVRETNIFQQKYGCKDAAAIVAIHRKLAEVHQTFKETSDFKTKQATNLWK